MSILEIQPQIEYGTLTETVRGTAESAIREKDPERMLQMISAVGQIATGI